MSTFLESIVDEETKVKLDQIIEDKNWSPELAAVAAKAGEGSVHIIDLALSAASRQSGNMSEDEQVIKRLRESYQEAMKQGNVTEAISIKNRLYQNFDATIGS